MSTQPIRIPAFSRPLEALKAAWSQLVEAFAHTRDSSVRTPVSAKQWHGECSVEGQGASPTMSKLIDQKTAKIPTPEIDVQALRANSYSALLNYLEGGKPSSNESELHRQVVAVEAAAAKNS